MPVRPEVSERPRSAIPPRSTATNAPVIRRSAPRVADDDRAYTPARLPTSTRRYASLPTTMPGYAQQESRRIHPLVWVGVILVAMIIGILIAIFVPAWWSDHQDDANYGFPRVDKTIAIVHGTALYLGVNNGGYLEVVELVQGGKSTAYPVGHLQGAGADRVAVRVSFQNVNGKVEMLVSFNNEEVVYVDNGTTFIKQ